MKHQDVLCHCLQNLLLINHLNYYFSFIFITYFNIMLLLNYKLAQLLVFVLIIYFVYNSIDLIYGNVLKYMLKNFLILPLNTIRLFDQEELKVYSNSHFLQMDHLLLWNLLLLLIHCFLKQLIHMNMLFTKNNLYWNFFVLFRIIIITFIKQI